MSKQPKGLYLLFFIELWERFSFYGLASILVLYVISVFHYSDNAAYALYGAYLALNYALPVLGGVLADRIIGYRSAIVFGNILLIGGNICLYFTSYSALYLGLALIVLGTSLFKPNVTSLLGTLYPPQSQERDKGFTVFYMGINVGSLLGPGAYGLIAQHYGWHVGFIAGSLGLAVGLLSYGFKRRVLNIQGQQQRIKNSWTTRIVVALGVLVLIPVAAFFLAHTALTATFLVVFGSLVCLFIIKLMLKAKIRVRRRMMVLVIFSIYALIFFACQWQLGSSLTLFIQRNIDRTILGYTLPTTFFFASQALLIVLLVPFITRLWQFLNNRNWEPSIPAKFAYGLILCGISFGIIAYAAFCARGNGYASAWWIFLGYAVMGLGELSLSPIGLSAITRYAPKNCVGFFIGAWFFATSIGGFLAGQLSKLTSVQLKPGEVFNAKLSALTYQHAFAYIGGITLLFGILAVALIPWLKAQLKEKA